MVKEIQNTGFIAKEYFRQFSLEMGKKDLLHETIAIYDALGARYADRIANVQLPQLQEFVGILARGAKVLDVGCAAGRDSALLHDAGFDVTGIDLSNQLLKLAMERVPDVKFQLMDARRVSFKRNSFDGIWAWAVLLNLERSEIPGVLRGFRKIMKAGGVCLIGVKEGEGEKLIGEPLVDNLKRRETYFQKSELESLLRNSGFRIVRSYIYDDPLGRSTTEWITIFARK